MFKLIPLDTIHHLIILVSVPFCPEKEYNTSKGDAFHNMTFEAYEALKVCADDCEENWWKLWTDPCIGCYCKPDDRNPWKSCKQEKKRNETKRTGPHDILCLKRKDSAIYVYIKQNLIEHFRNGMLLLYKIFCRQ